MNNTKSRENLRALVESAILVGIGFVLSYITLFRMPQGGSITPLSMLPILLIGMRHGIKWGLGGGFIYACLQMLQQFYPPPEADVPALMAIARYFAVVMLDYIAAFTVLGLSGLFRGKRFGMVIAAPLCLSLRFLFHFVSGIVIWGVYAPEGAPVWVFSAIYNGSYMGLEMVFTTAASAVLCLTAPIVFNFKPGAQQA